MTNQLSEKILKLKKEKTQAKIYQSSVRYGADRPARYQSFFV